MYLYIISPDQIDDWRVVLWPWLVSAAEHSGDRYDAEDIIARAKEGKMQLWVVMDGHIIKAVCVTEVTQYPKAKEMCIVIMTGAEMPLWVFMVEKLETVAREIGCKRLKGYARPGWERVMKPYGYQKTHVIIEKDL